MGEKALLVEIEKEKEQLLEKKLEVQRKVYGETDEQSQTEIKPLRLFSAKTFPENEIAKSVKVASPDEQIEREEEFEIKAEGASKSIDRPNYDFIEELSEKEKEKVYVLEKSNEQPTPKAKPSRFKIILLSILFAIFGVWGVINVTQINFIAGQIAEVSEVYNMNLLSYMNNLKNLDATNSSNMENLLDTIPEQELKPSGIERQSNWFDRFCNFIAGLFGG